jgi:DNA-binding PadR family transcriptional regulator
MPVLGKMLRKEIEKGGRERRTGRKDRKLYTMKH